MIRTFLCQFGLGLTLLSASALSSAEAQLNGISSHSELKKEKFIGALYTTNLTDDSNSALQSKAPMRMEIRVLAPRLSKRRFNRMWIEGMAINSSGSTLTQQADNMVKFTGFFKKKLLAGDVIELSNDSDDGTLISLNNVELGKVNDPEFFALLLRTWIGKVPLSSGFRDDILAAGNIDKDLLARFNALSPSSERQREIATWLKPKKADAKAVAATTAIASTAPIAPIAPAPIQPKTTAAANLPKIAAPTLAFNPEPTPEPEQQSQPEEVLPEETLSTVTPPPEDVLESAEDLAEEDEDILTAESLLARQLYISQMLRHAYGYIKYPSKAAHKGREGSVRLSVMVDREGKVKSILPIEESEYSSLNKAAWQAIQKAEPFPSIPEEIKGDSFEFSMPIVFRLKSK